MSRTMPRPIKVGLVGAGMAARFHSACLQRVYGVDAELAGVTSLRAHSREAFAREHGIPAFADIDSMLDAVDVLDVCSPPYAHEPGILAAAAAGKAVICEKPLTGYFGPPDADESYRGDRDDKRRGLEAVIASLQRIAQAVRGAGTPFGYAENFVYAPSVQKEREILVTSGAQILRMIGEESHNGSASPVYGNWRYAGGGSLIGKGCHPLTAMLYLKKHEGLARRGAPIRVRSVSAHTHQLTRLPAYDDRGLIRTDYHDVEDYGFMHVEFDDGTIADVLAAEMTLGGIYDYVEVFANNHRTRCHISPTHLVDTYNPRGEQFRDIYLIEKCSTKEGWSTAAPDENFTMGYQAEMQDFLTCIAQGRSPESDLDLALDTTATIYAAYLSDQQQGVRVEVPQL